MAAVDEQMPSPEALAAANTFMDDALAYDLDEVSPAPLKVAISEWHTIEETDPETNEKLPPRRARKTRHAVIESYVPMKLFNRMMATRQYALAARAAQANVVSSGEEDDDADPMMVWMLACVCSVWELTEPEMTMEILEEGLTFAQVQGLFARFFGAQIRQSSGKA